MKVSEKKALEKRGEGKKARREQGRYHNVWVKAVEAVYARLNDRLQLLGSVGLPIAQQQHQCRGNSQCNK